MGAAVDFLRKLGTGLQALGPRRLVALGVAGVTVFILVGTGSFILSRPVRDVLYAGLDAQDVSRIGAALNEAGIAFDVSPASDAVYVGYGETAKARMILAQQGLPKSDSAGYELFDKLGSLGLTSFMQQVTRVRALEGELARSIQLIDGIKAARVHLALRTESAFRAGKELATASVVIRGSGDFEAFSNAIRHLVAAAIPGLTPSQVTVMTTDGRLLSSSADDVSAAPERLIGLERSLSTGIEQNIARALAPYLGMDNFRSSVIAKLNADRRQTSETAFDPNSRVERSIRSFKESGEAQNANAAQPVSVDQNIPQEEGAKPASGDNSKEKKDRREELTNYEINTKTVATTSEGYGIERVSVAVVVNRLQVMKSLGDNSTPEQFEASIGKIEALVKTAAGLNDSRGDLVNVTAVDFVEEMTALDAVRGLGLVDRLSGQLGAFINAGAMVIVVILVLFLGLRPALRTIMQPALSNAADAAQLPGFAPSGTLPPFPPVTRNEGAGRPLSRGESGAALDDLTMQMSTSPRDRLVKIVELDPDRAAGVLRQWLDEPEGSMA